MTTRFQKHAPGRRGARGKLRKRPLQARSRETVEAILGAAARIFEAHGFAAGTTNRIAELAGVSIGTLYQYFSDKESVAIALLDRHVGEIGNRLDAWVGRVLSVELDLHGALADYVREMRDLHAGRPRLQHILLEEIPRSEAVHEMVHESGQRATRTLAGLLRTYPEVRRPRLDDAAFLVTQIVEPLTHHVAAHPNEIAMAEDSLYAELVAMLEAYLTADAEAGGKRTARARRQRTPRAR